MAVAVWSVQSSSFFKAKLKCHLFYEVFLEFLTEEIAFYWISLAISSYGTFDLQFLKYKIKNIIYTQQSS